jgi:micrococcal nuclease
VRRIGSIVLVALAVAGACRPQDGARSQPAASAPSAAAAAAARSIPTVGVGRSTAPSAAAAAPPEGATPAVVVGLVDGDTVDLDLAGFGRDRVRLIGIDTPETKKPNSPVECFGPEAAAQLAALIPVGTDVRLLRDVEVRDQFGRLLGYVFRASDGLFVNLAMVADGYADQLSIAPNTTFAGEISRLVSEARRAGRGLWSACPTDAATRR